MSRVGKHFAAPLLGVGLLLAACHPTGAEYVSDLDIVATTHDATFDFASVPMDPKAQVMGLWRPAKLG